MGFFLIRRIASNVIYLTNINKNLYFFMFKYLNFSEINIKGVKSTTKIVRLLIFKE
jgi:hypothetical protein